MKKQYNISITNTIAFITMSFGDFLDMNILSYISASLATTTMILSIVIFTKSRKQEHNKKTAITKSILEAMVSIGIIAISIANITI